MNPYERPFPNGTSYMAWDSCNCSKCPLFIPDGEGGVKESSCKVEEAIALTGCGEVHLGLLKQAWPTEESVGGPCAIFADKAELLRRVKQQEQRTAHGQYLTKYGIHKNQLTLPL